MGNKASIAKLTIGPVLGVVLAGGLSSRMGAQDKALLELAGQPMVIRVIDRLSPQVDYVVVSANQALGPVTERNIPIIGDVLPDYPGPLAGLLSAMEWARNYQPDVEWIGCISVDTPLFPRDLVQQLAKGCGVAQKAACAASNGRRHPTIGLFSLSLADGLRAFLEAGERKVGRWMDEIGAQSVEFDARDGDPFFNINTPEDLLDPIMQQLSD